MQRDIKSFFKPLAPSKKTNSEEESTTAPAKKKRKALVISSDEDEVPESPQVAAKAREHKKSRIEDKDKSPGSRKLSNKKPSLSKLKSSPAKALKPIDPTALFGGETVRVEAKKPPPPKDQAIIELENDEIDKSLMEIDVDVNISKNLQDTKNEKPETHKERRSKSKTPHKRERNSSGSPSKHKEKAEKSSSNTSKKQKQHSSDEHEALTPKSERKHKAEKHTPHAEKEQHADLESSVLSDEERHERKRMAAILYQKYKNRSSCINPGSKEVPKGKPNCLAGLTFLVTGVLESLERDEAGSIIKEYGGKLMTTVGKRLNYLIVGEDAGPKKLAQAEEYSVNVISEDGLFDLIREKSGDAATKALNGETKEKEKTAKSPKAKKIKEEVEVKQENSAISPEKKRKKEQSSKEERNNNESKIKQVKSESAVKQETTAGCSSTTKPKVNDDMLAWVDKYKPTTVKDIVGQFGPASNAQKLTNWLTKWYSNHDGKKKLQRPNPWAKNDDGSYFKAALLSGPPGIGKTTTATLVCKELGFDVVEFNASDTRSKRLLKEQVAELLSNKSLYGYFHGSGQAVTKKHVLVMDEVDGMAGNEDRGGIQELIALIKDSSVPIICMCNDRNHQKMRSLVNYCYDLRFSRPRLPQIKGRIMSICCRENFNIDPAKVEEIITATNNDIRQSINHISLLSAGKALPLKINAGKASDKTAEKDLKMGPWEVVRKVFSADDHKHMSFNDKCDLFFHDYSLAPLFVQQNYLQVSPIGPKSEVLNKVALTADALSLGDMVDKRIRADAAWSLLPTQAVFSSVMPGEYMCGHFTGQINFPGWLGKYSRTNKRSRLAQELHDHTRLRTSGSRLSMRLDYAPFLLSSIVRPLKEKGMDGVETALEVLKEYHLLREDIDSLIELTTWPGKKGIMDAVDGRVKAALTRAYNKEVLAYSYSVTAGIKKKKSEAAEDIEGLDLDGEEAGDGALVTDEEEDDSLENDGLIKAKKQSTAKTATSKAKGSTARSKKPAEKASKPKASTSKAKK